MPREFCAVTAATTCMPCTPSASIVLRSAWMPAPPPESDPATVSTRGGAGAVMPSTLRAADAAVEDARDGQRAGALGGEDDPGAAAGGDQRVAGEVADDERGALAHQRGTAYGDDAGAG